jgi:Ca2+-binding RTX toxin-like protein
VPRRTTLLFLATGLLTLVAAAPANASLGTGASVTTTQRPDLRSTLQITDPFREDNRMAFATVTPEGGSPDLVVGDLGAGIADPIPTICVRVDPTIIRCPLLMIDGANIGLGPGNDTFSGKSLTDASGYDISQFRIQLILGTGRDVALGGPGPNVIFGGAGRDMIMGGPLEDKLFGGAGNDFLVGEEGNDLLQCGKGPHDLFNDGPGRDLVNIRACERRVHHEFAP